jgi:hypothetical protein
VTTQNLTKTVSGLRISPHNTMIFSGYHLCISSKAEMKL